MIKYEFAPDIKKEAEEICRTIFPHIKTGRVVCLRSRGSGSRGTIARCHGLNKVMQLALGMDDGFYVLEFISERFDKLNENEKIKIIIHELMHIPKSFGGGFRHHDFVCSRNIDVLHKEYMRRKNESGFKF